jgi:hypothetical protein
LKLPSILDDYKKNKGIRFDEEEIKEKLVDTADGRRSGTNVRQDRKKQIAELPPAKNISKKPNSKQVSQEIQHLGPIVKPVDMSTNVKLTRTGDNQYKSVL